MPAKPTAISIYARIGAPFFAAAILAAVNASTVVAAGCDPNAADTIGRGCTGIDVDQVASDLPYLFIVAVVVVVVVATYCVSRAVRIRAERSGGQIR